jgi:hypothetical protein
MQEHNVVGVFENASDAQSVINALAQAGISRADIRLHPSPDDVPLNSDITTTSAIEHSRAPIAHLFRSLFGMDDYDDRHTHLYAESLRRGHSVVTVHSEEDAQLELAIDVMNRFSPIDIDDRAAHWKSQGWTGRDEHARSLAGEGTGNDRLSPASEGTPETVTAPVGKGVAANDTTSMQATQEAPQFRRVIIQRGGVRVFRWDPGDSSGRIDVSKPDVSTPHSTSGSGDAASVDTDK